tara:strand:- start:161 stop:1114 length:954 start_codon:yes stop_codon:yes gene_type:complete
MNESKENQNSQKKIYSAEDVVDLRYILIVWIKWSWILVPLILIGIYFGYRDLKSFVPVYEAKLLLQTSAGTSQQSAQLSQIANVLGGDSSQSLSGGATFTRLRLMIKSPILASHLQKKYGLMQEIYSDSWDSASNSWIKPDGKDFKKNEARKRFFKQPLWNPPNVEALADHIGGMVKFKDLPEQGFIHAVTTHTNPNEAKRFLNIIFSEADQLIREQDRARAIKRLKYLINKLEEVTNIDHRGSLISLLTKEQGKLMFLDSEGSYTAKIVDPIFVSRNPTSPDTRMMFAIPIIISNIIGFSILTLIALFIRESKKYK